MKTRIILLASLFWCLLMQTMAAPKPEKKLYVPMDYSTCGYRASEKAIPNVPNAVFVKAVDGDCTDRLQRAIDYVATLKPNSEGQRGAILLGVKAPVLIGHGSTSVDAIKNGTLATARAVRAQLVDKIAQAIAEGDD